MTAPAGRARSRPAVAAALAASKPAASTPPADGAIARAGRPAIAAAPTAAAATATSGEADFHPTRFQRSWCLCCRHTARAHAVQIRYSGADRWHRRLLRLCQPANTAAAAGVRAVIRPATRRRRRHRRRGPGWRRSWAWRGPGRVQGTREPCCGGGVHGGGAAARGARRRCHARERGRRALGGAATVRRRGRPLFCGSAGRLAGRGVAALGWLGWGCRGRSLPRSASSPSCRPCRRHGCPCH